MLIMFRDRTGFILFSSTAKKGKKAFASMDYQKTGRLQLNHCIEDYTDLFGI